MGGLRGRFAWLGCAAAVLLTAGQGRGGELEASPQRSAYFGDLHVHTMYSLDAFMMKNLRTTPDDAYRFAQGDAIPHPRGGRLRLAGPPLDFLAVTDHAEFLGAALAVVDVAEEGAEGYPVSKAVRRALGSLFKSDRMEAVMREAWRRVVAAAERHNAPGKFTALVAYEYTSNLGGNLHRNVIFKTAKVPPLPFSAVYSPDPEDLWDWLDRQRRNGIDALAIPHNMDKSDGLAFSHATWKGALIDRAFAEKRRRNEPVAEILQEKGNAETHPLLSPNDEWADFQIFRHYDGRENFMGDYWRKGLNAGLLIERRIGVNPYRLGAAGGSDSHLGAGAFEEANFFKTANTPQDRGAAHPAASGGWEGYQTPHIASHGTAGLTGIWAERNTRGALFDALRRRETFATSGPRLRVRLFGGFGLAEWPHEAGDPVAAGYAQGVPMGGVLFGKSRQAPSFFLWALRDPMSNRLQRAQIVKGWLRGGEVRERVFDIACSNGLAPDPMDHRCPDNGARVNLSDCSTTRDKGDVELSVLWTDPDFNAAERSYYYARVLENPSCRWSTWDAVRVGVEPNPALPPTIQERAWSSPIWYAPTAVAGIGPAIGELQETHLGD